MILIQAVLCFCFLKLKSVAFKLLSAAISIDNHISNPDLILIDGFCEHKAISCLTSIGCRQ